MPPFGPIKRVDFIHYLRMAGFVGPYSGKRHQFMIKEQLRVILPNPHRGDIGKGLLTRILHQAGISREEWEQL
jgi:predicted RNA binding protein YcfA (HicA-like mRNA interferase family)